MGRASFGALDFSALIRLAGWFRLGRNLALFNKIGSTPRQPTRECIEHIQQMRWFDRLGQTFVHACLNTAYPGLVGRIRRQGDDRQMRTVGRDETIELRHFYPIQHRHVKIDQNNIKVIVDDHFQSHFAIVGELDMMAAAFKDLGDDLLIGLIVLGNQNGQRQIGGALGRGAHNLLARAPRNVLPHIHDSICRERPRQTCQIEIPRRNIDRRICR